MSGRDVDATGERTRRDVLRVAGAGAVGLATGLAGCDGSNDGGGAVTTPGMYANYPVDGDSVTFGFLFPETGVFSGEGTQLRLGYDLAVQHLNEGGGWVDFENRFTNLGGDGVLGKTVQMATGNTKSDPTAARQAARTLLQNNDAIMIAGGASNDSVIAQQQVAQQERAIHMCGFAPANAVGGEECTRYGFQEMFNAKMIAQALAPVLADEYGTDVSFYQVSPSSGLGNNFRTAMRDNLQGDIGWDYDFHTTTRVGTSDYEEALQQAAGVGSEVVFLNYYGLDGANILRQAQDIIPEDMDIVVPLYDRSMAANAGDAMEGVIGTINWDSSIDTPMSAALTESWAAAYGERPNVADTPSGVAQLAYGQTLQYADAVERAGTFDPTQVIPQLEDHEYAMGYGTETMRACDHQAQRPVPVVRGRQADEQALGDFFELVNITRDIGYGCDEDPAGDCTLGGFTPTATSGE